MIPSTIVALISGSLFFHNFGQALTLTDDNSIYSKNDLQSFKMGLNFTRRVITPSEEYVDGVIPPILEFSMTTSSKAMTQDKERSLIFQGHPFIQGESIFKSQSDDQNGSNRSLFCLDLVSGHLYTSKFISYPIQTEAMPAQKAELLDPMDKSPSKQCEYLFGLSNLHGIGTYFPTFYPDSIPLTAFLRKTYFAYGEQVPVCFSSFNLATSLSVSNEDKRTTHHWKLSVLTFTGSLSQHYRLLGILRDSLTGQVLKRFKSPKRLQLGPNYSLLEGDNVTDPKASKKKFILDFGVVPDDGTGEEAFLQKGRIFL